jgi:hypothetical protein
MSELPPLMRDQRKVDIDHLRLLAIFHFVVASLAVVGLGFLALHFAFMHAFIGNPDIWKNQKGAVPPLPEFFAIFKWFYGFFAAVLVSGGMGNLLSGLFIRGRKNRVFSLVVAGLDFLQFPFGTVLGVFTFLVLLRDSVRELYENG